MPYEDLQNDVLKYQGRGAQILLCGDFNATTAEEPDFLRMAELQPFLPNTSDDDNLPDDIPHRRNCDQGTLGSQNWGPELLEFCQQANLLNLNGRTPRNEFGQFTFQTAQGHSTIDYFIASAQCMTAVQSLHVLEQASRYHSDHNPLFLHFACESLTCAPIPTPSAESGARMRYGVPRAEAYQVALASELQQHFISLIQHELDVDLLADKFVACLTSAASCMFARAVVCIHTRTKLV